MIYINEKGDCIIKCGDEEIYVGIGYFCPADKAY